MQVQTPKNIWKKISFLIIFSFIMANLFAQSPAWAQPPAPAASSSAIAKNALIKIRTSQFPQVVRIVFEMGSLPDYAATVDENQRKITVSLPGIQNVSNVSRMTLNDPVVEELTITDDKNKLQAVISLKSNMYVHKIFTLQNPNRLVIDIIKNYEEKKVEQLTPAIKYTSLQRVTHQGRIWAHILEVSPDSGYVLRPVLGKSAIRGLESLSSMSERTGALAMVNGAYFHTDGSIIGLLKMNKEIASTSEVPRTALGIMGGSDPRVIIGQPHYAGKIEFFNKQTFPINAVNRERGPNQLLLYNGWYEASTKTNPHGLERTVMNGKVIAENINNSHIPKGAVVLSGHGAAAQILEQLKIGDDVKIIETLGPEWDKAAYVVGAGPMLVQNHNIFLTTKLEEFGSDVADGRAPRTAIGVTDNETILLVVIDGRQATSVGMTLLELARFMQELGARDAMNLDGGGSSEMVVKDRVVNRPSDGRERRMGNGIALVPARN